MKAEPAQRAAKQQLNDVGYPDPRSEQLKRTEVHQVRARRREFKEITIDELAVQQPLGVHPKYLLISAQEKGCSLEGEQVETEVDGAAEKDAHVVAAERCHVVCAGQLAVPPYKHR